MLGNTKDRDTRAEFLKFNELLFNKNIGEKLSPILDSDFTNKLGKEEVMKEGKEDDYCRMVDRVLEDVCVVVDQIESGLRCDDEAVDFVHMCRKLAETAEEIRKESGTQSRVHLSELKKRGDFFVDRVKKLENRALNKLFSTGTAEDCTWEETKDGNGRRFESDRGTVYIKEEIQVEAIEEDSVPKEYWVINRKHIEDMTLKGYKIPGVKTKKVFKGSFRCSSLDEIKGSEGLWVKNTLGVMKNTLKFIGTVEDRRDRE